MLKEWIKFTQSLLKTEDHFHVSGKRISRNAGFSMSIKALMGTDLDLDMLGFSKRKISMLTQYYFNEESVEVALVQLAHRRKTGTYGSACLTCYNHLSKKERPMHGPCIQSVVFTYLPGGRVDVDIFYRTTEAFKKFAADLLWLRDVLLPPFNLDKAGKVTFHFANATYHPMYWCVSAPYLDDAVAELKQIKKTDEKIWKGIIRWTNRFVLLEDNLLKFKQGYRVAKHLHRLMPKAEMKELAKYITMNYKSLKSDVELDEDDEDV